jgi:uridylate kinase
MLKGFSMAKRDLVIMSLGGSIIVPDEVDVGFLKRFRDLILKHIKKGKRFIIITGGGKTCRKYQKAAARITKLTDEDLDWLGIHATRFNAHLLRTIFRAQAHPRVIKNPTEKLDFKEDILIGAGWRPGCSTDWDSVMIAENFKARKLINLSNIKYVCDKDPKFCKDAKPIPEMTWKEFRGLVGDKWDPGANLPFDPVASKEAERIGLEVAIMDGTDLSNLEGYLEGKPFKGTVIR